MDINAIMQNPIAQSYIAAAIYDVTRNGFLQIFRREPYAPQEISFIRGENGEKNNVIKDIIQKEISKINDINFSFDTEGVLQTPETQAVVRQIFSTYVIEEKKEYRAIEMNFLSIVTRVSGCSSEEVEKQGKVLLSLIIRVCEQLLCELIDKEHMAAHEIKSSLRYNIMMGEIKGIKKNLDFLEEKTIDLNSVNRFVVSYSNEIKNRHGFIKPPHMEETIRIPIDDLYVSPKLYFYCKEKKNKQEIQFSEFISSAYRVVILGDPGGGKSTLSNKICCELAKSDSKIVTFRGMDLMPIIITLYDYGISKKDFQNSILEYIKNTSRTKYQQQPSEGVFEYLLLNGRAVVIFDGLDELLDTRCRQEISEDVESFCRMYPSIPVIVTSREVGYEQAPLSEDMFKVFRLGEFSDLQVKEYITKWFGLIKDLEEEEKKQIIESFLKESKTITDIRSNPLLLSLLCNIYKNENYIPKSRASIYEKCADLLFDKWDKKRGIKISIPFSEVHLRFVMQYLAQWIFFDEKRQKGVLENELISKVTDYLSLKLFEDRLEAEKAATEFIQFCRGRAWLFSDVGTNAEGEKIYQFSHNTFLEYFSAEYIVRNMTIDDLSILLMGKIINYEWDVVAQLVIQLVGNKHEGATEEILWTMIEEASGESNSWGYVSFLVRCLGFIVPPPIIRREITTLCLYKSFILANGYKKRPKLWDGLGGHKKSEPATTLANLFLADQDNIKTIEETIGKIIVDDIKNGTDVLRSLMAAEFILSMNNFVGKKDEGRWGLFQQEIIKSLKNELRELATKNFNICYLGIGFDVCTIKELITWFGGKGFFAEKESNLFPFLQVPMAHKMFRLMMKTIYEDEKANLSIYEEIACELAMDNPPWYGTVKGEYEERFDKNKKQMTIEEKKSIISSVSPNIKFLLFVDCAIRSEYVYASLSGNISDNKWFTENIFKKLLIARYQPEDNGLIKGEVSKYEFSLKQEKIILDWIDQKVDFCIEKQAKKKDRVMN